MGANGAAAMATNYPIQSIKDIRERTGSMLLMKSYKLFNLSEKFDWGRSQKGAAGGVGGVLSSGMYLDSPTSQSPVSTKAQLGSARVENVSTRFTFDFNKSFSIRSPLSFRGNGGIMSQGASARNIIGSLGMNGISSKGVSYRGAGASSMSIKPVRAKSIMGSAGLVHFAIIHCIYYIIVLCRFMAPEVLLCNNTHAKPQFGFSNKNYNTSNSSGKDKLGYTNAVDYWSLGIILAIVITIIHL